MSDMLHVSSSPHIRSKIKTDWIMYMVLIALLPGDVYGNLAVWSPGAGADPLLGDYLRGDRVSL